MAGRGSSVFISSVVRGYSEPRNHAAQGIVTAGYIARRSEDFGALDESPQLACLQGVRDCDLMVLLVGARYGDPQASGLSATHEEFREAIRLRKPILAFVEEGAIPEERQAAFIREVRDYLTGRVTGGFRLPNDLSVAVNRALLVHEQGLDTRRADPAELSQRAQSYVEPSNVVGPASLIVVMAGGPSQTILRPSELSHPKLAKQIMQLAMFGEASVLVPGRETVTRVRGRSLVLSQRDSSVLVDEQATVRVTQPATTSSVGLPSGPLPALIHEDIEAKIELALGFCLTTLDAIDPDRRITDVILVGALDGSGYLPWRTRAAAQASPNSATINPRQPKTTVVQVPGAPQSRLALRLELAAFATDLAELLAREVR